MFDNRDVYLMLGTEYKYNNFIIGGLYYPPKIKSKSKSKTQLTTLDL